LVNHYEALAQSTLLCDRVGEGVSGLGRCRPVPGSQDTVRLFKDSDMLQ
jgi:hypothetical protein